MDDLEEFTAWLNATADKPPSPVVAAPAPLATVLPAFPLDALPPFVSRWASATARAMQTSADLPAMLALGAASAALRGRVDLEVMPGYTEPLALYLAVAMPTGERKSPVLRAAFASLRAAERDAIIDAKPRIAKAKARRDLLARTETKKQTEFASLSRTDQKQHLPTVGYNGAAGGLMILKELEDIAIEKELCVVPAVPVWFVDDITSEAFAERLAQQDGVLAVVADEASIFQVMNGRYSSDGAAGAFEVYLQAYSGMPISSVRKGKDPILVTRPRVTMALTVQPSIIQALMGNAAMRSQGLLARFCYSFPTSKVGRRDVTAALPVPTEVTEAYDAALIKLAAPPTAGDVDGILAPPSIITLTDDARRLHMHLQATLEPRLHPTTGDLAELVDWASKWHGQVARIAGVLHCLERGPRGEVDESTMGRAIQIGEYLLAHARHAYGALSVPKARGDAEILRAWLLRCWSDRSKPALITMRDIRRNAPRPIRDDRVRILAAMQELVDDAFVTSTKGRPGAPASESWLTTATAAA